jgi:predicted nucleic acid-binding protein
MKPFQICVDTNIWIDYIEKRTAPEKSRELIQMLTDVHSPHKIIVPKILYIEIVSKLIDNRKEKYLITKQGYSSIDFKSPEGKKIKFNFKLPKKEMREIKDILLEFENSDKIEIVSPGIDLGRAEFLVKEGFELMDSLIIVQIADGKADYFVTRDRVARRINEISLKWVKFKATTVRGMIKLLRRLDNNLVG